uniref:DUF4283 domain-containing protein n=1 Tax=Chenopodium quinoa TaxID=63459 RepID=A0A803N630_CHEQI
MGIGIPKQPYDYPEDVDKFSLAVVGKVLDDRIFFETQIQNWVDLFWKTNTAIIVQKASHSKDIFFFFCTSYEDRDNLMSLRFAPDKGALVVFKAWQMGSNILGIDFSESTIWIKFEGLPTEECQPQVARRILERVGRIIRFDQPLLDDRPHCLMRAKLVVNVQKPLILGFYYEITLKKVVWVFLRYEGVFLCLPWMWENWS